MIPVVADRTEYTERYTTYHYSNSARGSGDREWDDEQDFSSDRPSDQTDVVRVAGGYKVFTRGNDADKDLFHGRGPGMPDIDRRVSPSASQSDLSRPEWPGTELERRRPTSGGRSSCYDGGGGLRDSSSSGSMHRPSSAARRVHTPHAAGKRPGGGHQGAQRYEPWYEQGHGVGSAHGGSASGGVPLREWRGEFGGPFNRG